MLKPLDLSPVGDGQHRSGWPYCLDALQPLFASDAPVVFEDFVERTFFYDGMRNRDITYRQPWVGVMHHPPDMPEWYLPWLRLQQLFKDRRWAQSLPHLRLLITLGDNLRDWCQQTWPQVPCVVIKHPTGLPQLYWSPAGFMARRQKQVVQVGWFLRNVTAIDQVKVAPTFQKIHLYQDNDWARKMYDACKKQFAISHPQRRDQGNVQKVTQLDDAAYDVLLAESVVFIEVISAVANNTVVECIARNTPLCINRHAGPLSYLGPDYPLYYDRFEDVENVLTIENIMAAHQYLTRMDKWWLRGAMFREQVRTACLTHVPECRTATMMSPSQEYFCEP